MSNFLKLIIFFVFATVSQAQEILPAKEVFIPQISASEQEIIVSIDFPKGYYLYAEKTFINEKQNYHSETPAVTENDPYLGITKIWNEPVNLIVSKNEISGQTLELKTQGCQKNIICYPPISWTLQIPSEALPSQKINLFKSNSKPSFLNNSDDLLPVEQAFPVLFTQDEAGGHFQIKIPENYYLYKERLFLKIDGKNLAIQLPEALPYYDEYFKDTFIYRDNLQFSVPKSAFSGGKELQFELQGCAEHRLCYPPFTWKFPLNQDVTSETTTQEALSANQDEKALTESQKSFWEQDWQEIIHNNYWSALLLIFVLGLILSFSACIYPLIPIVSSLVVGENIAPRKAQLLLLTYIVAMGFGMALLGLLFSAFNFNLQIFLQKPIFSLLAAGLFLFLALSLFGFFTLQMPKFLRQNADKISNQQKSGSYSGAAIMGLLSVLLVSPCATPVLSALLLFSTQTTWEKSAFALFIFGFANGLPLLIFASVFKKYLPRAGAWMDKIKRFFAFALLALAFWLGTRAFGITANIIAAIIFVLILSINFLPKRFPPQNFGEKTQLFFAFLALLSAFVLSLRLFSTNNLKYEPEKRFQIVHNLNEVEQQIKNSVKPTILDFYADWCISCRVWERNIWQNPQFSEELAKFNLIKVDMTNFNAEHQALLSQWKLFGPPAVILFNPTSNLDKTQEIIIGELSAQEFATKLKLWQK